MDTVTVRELRNQGGDVIKRVVAGESLIVTRAGTPVAELRPLQRPIVDRSALVERWRRLPHLDADDLRRDIDAVIDQSL